MDICLCIFALEGVEAGRLTAFQRHISTAASSDEDFGTTVFIEEEDSGFRIVFLYLAEEEVDKCRFTGTGLTNNHGVGNGFLTFGIFTFKGCMEVKVVGLTIGCLKNGNALPPWVALTFTNGKVVKRTEAQEI